MKKVNEFIENERTLMDLEYEFVKEFVNLRKEKGLTQELSSVLLDSFSFFIFFQ